MSRPNRKQLKCPSSALQPSLESIEGPQQDSVLGRVTQTRLASGQGHLWVLISAGRGLGQRGGAPCSPQGLPSVDVEGRPRSPSRPRGRAGLGRTAAVTRVKMRQVPGRGRPWVACGELGVGCGARGGRRQEELVQGLGKPGASL